MTELDPHSALVLAVQHHQAGRLDAAQALYERVLAVDAANADALHLLGVVRTQRGLPAAAVPLLRRAFARVPAAEIAANLAGALLALDRPDAAMAAGRTALALAPGLSDAWCQWGNALYAQGRVAEALASYRRALALRPDSAELHNTLGGALLSLERLDEALATLRTAAGLAPDHPDIRLNLGIALWMHGRPDEALATLRTGLALRPDHSGALNNLGLVLQEQGLTAMAAAAYAAAIAAQPDNAEARFNHALILLKQGRFAEAMADYRWRWRAKSFRPLLRRFAVPAWDGRDPVPGRLLVWSEQGLGDEVMLAGLFPDLIRRGIRCVLECSPRLTALFARSFPEAEVVPRPEDPPPLPHGPGIAAHIESGDLIPILRPSLAAFAGAGAPYLRADPALRAELRARYGGGLVVGVSWHTRNRFLGPRRSVPLEALRPLLAVPGVRWVCLQYGDPDRLAADLAAAGADVLIDRAVDTRDDLDAFAAQVAAMDLVVTIDNTTAHMAGALGVPAWVLLDHGADWRWLTERDDSPWYPSVRLFRQTVRGDWTPVVEQAAAALAKRATPPPAPPRPRGFPTMRFDPYDPEAFTPLFIGGAMRSGTSILHALVCTSPAVNHYIAECSYLTALLNPAIFGINHFDLHTRFYFADPNAFATYHSQILRKVVADTWVHLGCPRILALKDPNLTPNLGLLMTLLPGSRFLVSVRDPRGVVASRVTAERRRGAATVTPEALDGFCRDYLHSYQGVGAAREAFGERVALIRYEAMVEGGELDTLAAFGIPEIRPEAVWRDGVTDPAHYRGQPFDSPLYGRPVTNEAVHSYREVLSEAEQARVLERCGAMARSLGVAL